MNIEQYETREEWMDGRRGRVTGSTLKDLVVKRGTEKKVGFYRLIAERIAAARSDEDSPMDRGTRLEEAAIARLTEDTGISFDTSLVIWSREDNRNIAISPDGFAKGTDGVVRVAAEVKCLSPELHIKAWLTQKVPSEYWEQVLQYFAVNDALELLYFVLYDPSIPAKEFFYIEVTRAEVQDEVTYVLDYQRQELAEIDEAVLQLTF